MRTTLWLDPETGRILDKAAGNSGPLAIVHRLHGSLLVPGAGRQIVGAIGIAMLLSSLTGLWLWWPMRGRWTRGLRWRRRGEINADLHHQAGFWIALPLAMLSFTGAWISFPQLLDRRPADAAQVRGAPPLPAPALTVDAAVAAARGSAAGPAAAVTWPTERSPAWSISFAGRPGEIRVDDSTGRAVKSAAPASGTLSATMRRWHDGTGMGLAWRIVITLGGLAPALLAVTGIAMWVRSRRWRRPPARRTGSGAPAAA
jgi:uncharacterized iron-regulated membrane protein